MSGFWTKQSLRGGCGTASAAAYARGAAADAIECGVGTPARRRKGLRVPAAASWHSRVLV
eukprot:11703562-Heterocapsa_arctica.AAC.1